MAKTKLPKGMMYTPDGMMKISDYEKRTSPKKESTVSIPTKTKKNEMGELINPTKKDVDEFNKKYSTYTPLEKVRQDFRNKTSTPSIITKKKKK